MSPHGRLRTLGGSCVLALLGLCGACMAAGARGACSPIASRAATFDEDLDVATAAAAPLSTIAPMMTPFSTDTFSSDEERDFEVLDRDAARRHTPDCNT